MPEFVRIKLANGHEATTTLALAKRTKAEVLDTPATDRTGRPLPASRVGGRRIKPRTTVAAEAAKRRTKGGADGGPIVGDYATHKVVDLRAEVGRRNADRDPAGDGYLTPASNKKADLVAALEADDTTPETPATDAGNTPLEDS